MKNIEHVILWAAYNFKFNYSFVTIGIDNTEIEKPVDYPKDPELCCKKQGVPENCLGLCKNVGSRSLSNEKSFTSACEQHKLTIMRCIVGSFPLPDDTKEVKGNAKTWLLYFFLNFYNSLKTKMIAI